MPVMRLLLALLVAINLSMICQGHTDEGDHAGPHLSLMGESHPPAKEPLNEPAEPKFQPGSEGGSWLEVNPPLPALSTLALALLPFLAILPGRIVGQVLPAPLDWQTQPPARPDHPPPRVRLCPAFQ